MAKFFDVDEAAGPFNPHAAHSRWFDGPPLMDVTPRERALLDELARAIAFADGLVQVGWRWRHPITGRLFLRRLEEAPDDCQPVYVKRADS